MTWQDVMGHYIEYEDPDPPAQEVIYRLRERAKIAEARVEDLKALLVEVRAERDRYVEAVATGKPPPCDFCRREIPCECVAQDCMCTCGRCVAPGVLGL